MKGEAGAGRKTGTRNGSILGVLPLLLLFVPSVHADPVMPSHQGCVTTLPDGGAAWTSTRHFQFVASWDPVSGCSPTITHAMVLHEWLEDVDGTGGLRVETVREWFPRCGRIQFDAQSYLSAASNVLDPMGLVSLVFDTGVDCAPSEMPLGKPVPPTSEREVPEPPLIALLASGTAILRCCLRTTPSSVGT